MFPSLWASLAVPSTGFQSESPADIVAVCREHGLPMSIASQPALWGGSLRGGTDVLIQSGTLQIEKATSEDHATDLVQAHLIETLSAVGRETIDFYFLPIRRALEEYQINGALAALEFAKQEGHVRFLGLKADGPGLAVLGMWQFHDAFEALWVKKPLFEADTYETLVPLAQQRRVGVLVSNVDEAGYGLSVETFGLAHGEQKLVAQNRRQHPVLMRVDSTQKLQATFSSDNTFSTSEISEAEVRSTQQAFNDANFWQQLSTSTDPAIQKGFAAWKEDQD